MPRCPFFDRVLVTPSLTQFWLSESTEIIEDTTDSSSAKRCLNGLDVVMLRCRQIWVIRVHAHSNGLMIYTVWKTITWVQKYFCTTWEPWHYTNRESNPHTVCILYDSPTSENFHTTDHQSFSKALIYRVSYQIQEAGPYRGDIGSTHDNGTYNSQPLCYVRYSYI